MGGTARPDRIFVPGAPGAVTTELRPDSLRDGGDLVVPDAEPPRKEGDSTHRHGQDPGHHPVQKQPVPSADVSVWLVIPRMAAAKKRPVRPCRGWAAC